MNKSSIIVISVLLLIIVAIISKSFEGKKTVDKEIDKKIINNVKTKGPIKTTVANNIKTIKPEKSTIKKGKIKKDTMANKAYKKLRTDNMINEDFIVVVYVLQEIDENMRSIKIEEGLFGYISQTFEFSDESKIRLSKKQKNNGDFRFIPYATQIIND